ILVVFNAEGDQPDHADRAARCGTALIREADRVAAGHPGWPRFRVGIATGPAAVGTVGAGSRRSFATIGDTTNLASRLMSLAEPGQVVIGPETRAALGGDGLSLVPLGSRQVKGKREPVETWAVDPAAAP
ncbi:MAG TPA: adenylate/guanylate cyclase domain-containing protein, partial [Candidatus Limnocylindria bacterium]|nr:adenylate/guanylate cyclase domain-containing protein [Candidatus Limnocylindria bacterium]